VRGILAKAREKTGKCEGAKGRDTSADEPLFQVLSKIIAILNPYPANLPKKHLLYYQIVKSIAY
jgi:hypothetical protein